MTLKQINVSKQTVFIALLITATGLLLMPRNLTKRLNFLFVRLFNPVLNIGRTIDSDAFQPIISHQDIVSRIEYDRLLTAHDNLRADLITLLKRYEKLAKIRSGLPNPGPALEIAEVIKVSVAGLRHELFINKGHVDDIRVGQYVLGENSFIGTVSDTTEHSSIVRLLTDANFKLKINILRRGQKRYRVAHMTGDGKSSGKIPLVSREYDLLEGDTVYAAAKSGSLDTPRVIGEISKVQPDEKEPLLWDITVTPICKAEMLKFVAVVVNISEKK